MNSKVRSVLFLMMVALLMAACGAAQPTATVSSAAQTPVVADTLPPPTERPAPAATMIPPTESPSPTEPPPRPAETPTLPIGDDTWPSARIWHRLGYDAQSNRVLLFSGYNRFETGYPPRPQLVAGDEWAYDVERNQWEPLDVVHLPGAGALAYDEGSDQLIGFGPEGTSVYDIGNRCWVQLHPTTEPERWRFGFSLAYDSQSDRIVLFGGWPELDDTWAYDYDTNTWTEMSPGVSLPHRSGYAMAYDAGSDRVILWGAEEYATGLSEEETTAVWAYDYDSNTWTAQPFSGGPSFRGGHTMVYHSGTDRIILFGGYHEGDLTFSDETWAYDYDTNTWTLLTPATHPSGRRYHAMIYDPAADKMVLFGGDTGTFRAGPYPYLDQEISDELWIFDPVVEEWSQVTPDSLNP